MLNAFLPGTPGAVGFAPTDSPEPLDRAVWIDVADPLAWEKPMVEERFGLSLPTRAGMTEIEASSRTFRSRGAVFLTIPLVVGLASDDPRTVPVTFILMRERLITMRYGDPQPFRILTSAYEHQPPPADPMLVLLRLLELVVDRAADTLEHMGSENRCHRPAHLRRAGRPAPVHRRSEPHPAPHRAHPVCPHQGA